MQLPERSGNRMSLFWRVFLANATILIVGIAVLTFAQATLPEIVDLIVGLTVMVVVNWLVLRPLFRPLERLADRMDDADVLRAGLRVSADSPGEVGTLERAFNAMMARLETERRVAGRRALQVQEEQRQRIARGLHDEVGQTMTGVLFQLKRLTNDATPEQLAVLAGAQEAVRSSLDEVRRIAQELRPEVLDHLGLASALADLARTFSERTGIAVRREVPASLPPLDAEVELALYRVAQESLTNAARHGEATEILLSLACDDEEIVLRVVDNGRGFDGSPVEGGGLRGIRERALILDGAAAIKPAGNGGVEIRVQVPARKRVG